MWRLLGFSTAVIGLVTFASAELHAQKKGKTVDKATAEEMKQIQNAKELVGRLAFVESGSSLVTLRLEIPHMEPNPNFNKGGGGGGKGGNNNNQMQNMYRQQQELMRITNPVERQRRMAQLMQQMQKQQYQQMMQAAKAKGGGGNNGPFKMVVENKDFDLELSDKVVIRKMTLGTEFDDKGFIKEYTKEELAKLRGKDTSKPGYEAKFSELSPGQKVRLMLAPPKNAAGKKDEDGKAKVPGPIVTMIVVLPEVNENAGAAPKKKNR